MTISKTTFINYTRCPRYCSLDNIKKERLNADITYKEYQDEEKFDKLLELISGMYDEDEEGYVCDVDMDEDDYARLLGSSYRNCPYYQSNDEYKVVRHQM